jgi:hypothetical protein
MLWTYVTPCFFLFEERNTSGGIMNTMNFTNMISAHGYPAANKPKLALDREKVNAESCLGLCKK